MVQEFHVLRCFSCETFQVQQVKKSKKWTCKVCGEKQSLIKEFGRGTGADCRRHVQKLNALRGQVQEATSERLMTQWDEDERYDNEDVHESLDQTPKSEQEVTHVSRWSKYTDQTAKSPSEDEDDGENIYTERHQFRSQGNRKRKKNTNLKSFGGANDICEGKESRTMFSGFKRRPYLPLQHEGSWNKGCTSRYSSCDKSGDVDPCISTNLPSSHQADCHYPIAGSSSMDTAENGCRDEQQHNNSDVAVTKCDLVHAKSPSVSSHHNFGESVIEKKDSKWSKFLTIVQDEEESDCQDQNSSQCNNIGYRQDEKNRGGVQDRQKSVGDVCGDKSLSPTNSHPSTHAAFGNAICKQLPLAKTPSFSLNSLFCTNEDFDDTF